ncbi:MAG: hypothetical protein EHM40_20955 [Chloroflexi bacterium]|nr:MAG: hypothetical protein EHM40_20955 [Chloroflexota bacterium]
MPEKRKISEFLEILVVISLAACSNASPTRVPFSPVTLSPTLLPTKTPVPTGIEPVKSQCFEVLPALPSEVALPGILVLSKPDGLSLLDFSQQTRREIAGLINAVSVSPNGKWLSYTFIAEDVDEKIVIESADGKIQTEIPTRQGWLIFDKVLWLDNERLWFPVFPEIRKGEIAPTVIINPFTGEQKQLSSAYPGIKRYQFGFATAPGLHFQYSSVVYHPSLNLVIYPEEGESGWYITLWDKQSGKVLARIPEGGLYGHLPMWFPDGSRFVVVARWNWDRPREWFEVSQDGGLRQLTHFEDSYADFDIGQYASLSPNGRYLAFGLSPTEDGGVTSLKELLILNMETLETINTCITLDYPAPVWSSDSQYLAVLTRRSTNKPSGIAVLDIRQGWAAKISEEPKTHPMGWLESP